MRDYTLNTILHRLLAPLAFLVLVVSCAPRPHDARAVDSLPDIYPDYVEVTVPVNIAPLNFMLRTPCRAVYATAECGSASLTAGGRGNEVSFDLGDWRRLLQSAVGDSLTLRLSALLDDGWVEYRPFAIHVSPDSIDPYLTYRLIEPDYEVFSRLQIQERCLEDFSVRAICDHNMVGNRCMNCHTYASNRPDLSFLYVRGEGGGMILNEGGSLRKVNLRTPDMVSGSVYAQFSPSGRYLAFSSNVIIPAFHSDPSKRLEVFDTKSDVFVADLATNTVLGCPLLADSARLETFPAFGPDGSLYYCVADGPANPECLDSLLYSLCRVTFDEAAGVVGEKVDTIVAGRPGRSVSHPRVSPDGRRLLYTVSAYGTFPIWHPEADLRMLDLVTGATDSLACANSCRSDTYHSWSSSGRWFVFASKRDDGLYGKPYFCHVSADGRVSRPFVLPQRSPSHYDDCLKSYNVPELGKSPVLFDAADVAAALERQVVGF